MSDSADPTDSSPPSSPSWRDIFPYDEAYDQQRDGIEQVRQTADDGGFVLLEGACGTGKTLIALCAGLEAVRDPSTKYERVFCMTSVKQQLRAFENDLQSINDNLPDDVHPIRGLSIVGKRDMCSYVDTGHIRPNDIYQSCENLRDQVRRRVDSDDVEQLTEMIGAWSDGNGTLETDEWSSPYSTADPENADSPPGCPFYAEYLRERRTTEENEPVFRLRGIYRPEELIQEASDNGLCPHAVMADSIEGSEVVVGNYRHAFDPVTVQAMTGALLDEETFVVCDEAHTIIEVVRSLLSEQCSLYALDQTIHEVDNFILDPQTDPAKAASQIIIEDLTERLSLAEPDVRRLVVIFRNMVTDIREKLIDYADEAARDELGRRWKRRLKDGDVPYSIEHPLRDAEKIETDELTEWIENSDYEYWDDIGPIGDAIGESIREASKVVNEFARVQTYCDGVGHTLDLWLEMDNENYFREVELTRRNDEWERPDNEWQRRYNAKFSIKNCIPLDGISDTLDQFGGGILMSATLEPFDAFKQETGLDEFDRPVEELSYGLNFPERNRESLIVDLDKFTYTNRGNPGDMNDLRKQYAQVIRDVAETTEGNVLVGMPSYSEGEWAAEILEDSGSVEKEVLIDKSSGNDVTEELKQDFFEGEGKILVTSMRGTLTEGVDYDGDRLDACVICGLPIRMMGSPHATAIETAYKRRFGDFEGYAYGFAVPALRKARQALGRVIRSDDDVGVRVMVDGRYASGYLRKYMPRYERNDYRVVDPIDLRPTLNSFWRRRG